MSRIYLEVQGTVTEQAEAIAEVTAALNRGSGGYVIATYNWRIVNELRAAHPGGWWDHPMVANGTLPH